MPIFCERYIHELLCVLLSHSIRGCRHRKAPQHHVPLCVTDREVQALRGKWAVTGAQLAGC